MVSVVSRFSEKNVRGTCCIDIKTNEDKEEEGSVQWLQLKAKEWNFWAKKKSLNGYSAWAKQGTKDGNETVRYIRVSVEQGSTVAQHVILQHISL